MENVSKEYKDLFNLSYVLAKEGKDEYYKALMNLYDRSKVFRETDSYKALADGRRQALIDNHLEQGKDMTQAKEKTEQQLRDEQMADMTRDYEKGKFGKFEKDSDDDPEPPKPRARQTGLSEKQLNELEDWEAKEQDRAARKEFKEGTRRINENTYENLQAHKLDEEQKKEAEAQKIKSDEKEQNFLQRFLNKGKDKDKNRGRD